MGAAIKPSIQENSEFNICPLLWLDRLVNTFQPYLEYQKQVRSSIDHLKTFESVTKCDEYIQLVPSDERIILIVCIDLARQIIPKVHHLRQVSCIYIYCLDQPVNEHSIRKYKKIRSVVQQVNQLTDEILSQRSKRDENEINELLPISIFQTNAYHEQLNNSFNDQFIYSHLLIHALFQLRPLKEDKLKLIRLLKEKYAEINVELKIIQEFESKYSSTTALEWYSRESCISRLLNKVLRIQHIDVLFLFQFFLHDLRQAILQNECRSPILVYRCQLMTRAELNSLESCIGRLISIDSFFSTSTRRELAMHFLNNASIYYDDLERVIFEIDADPSYNLTKPFGYVKSNNSFRQSEEVLFTVGSIFRLTKVYYQPDGLWIIHLSFCPDNDSQLKKIFQSFRATDHDNEVNLLSFGNFSKKMSKLYEAGKFFARLLNESSDNYQEMADSLYALGSIEVDKKANDLGLKFHQRSLEIKLSILHDSDTDTTDITTSIADSYTSIGQIYLKKSMYKQALSSYERALRITIQALGENHPNVAACYTNLGGIYQKQENYVDALECHKKALTIRENYLSVDQPDLGVSHNNIAIIYACLRQYDLALEHYNISLEILKNTLPPIHPELAVSYCGLGLVYEQRGQLEKALSFYGKTATIYRQTLSTTHPDVIDIEQHIQRISNLSR